MINLDGTALAVGVGVCIMGLLSLGVGGVVSAVDNNWRGMMFYLFFGSVLVIGGYLQIGYALQVLK